MCKKNHWSYFNEEELEAVMTWIRKLLKTECNGNKVNMADIGVISPYKAQCDAIMEELDINNLTDITVGSAETFQGQEKRVIIISTVRTSGNLHFVKDGQVR